MVRALLTTSLIALLSACNTFTAVDEYRPGDAGTDDSSEDNVSTSDGEVQECPGGQERNACPSGGCGEYLICVCETCLGTSYTYVGIELAGDEMFAKGAVQIDEDGVLSGEDPLDGQHEASASFRWYTRGERHFIVLAHQTEPKLYFLLRDPEDLSQRALAGPWAAVGVFREDGDSEFRSISHEKFDVDAEGDSIDGGEISLKVDEAGEVLLQESSKTWQGTLAWDRTIGVLTPHEGEGVLIIGPRRSSVTFIDDIEGSWHVTFVSLAVGQQWTAFQDGVGIGANGVIGGELTRVPEEMGSLELTGRIEPTEGGAWEASNMAIESDAIASSGWLDRSLNTMVGGTSGEDDPILNVWIRAD